MQIETNRYCWTTCYSFVSRFMSFNREGFILNKFNLKIPAFRFLLPIYACSWELSSSEKESDRFLSVVSEELPPLVSRFTRKRRALKNIFSGKIKRFSFTLIQFQILLNFICLHTIFLLNFRCLVFRALKFIKLQVPAKSDRQFLFRT